MLKYLPKDVVAQWAIGSVAVAGAASVAYVVVFADDPVPTTPPQVILAEPADPALPAAELAPEVQVAMAMDLAESAPKFDMLRVTDVGNVLIAGRAPATSAVSALLDETPVAQSISSSVGEFVMMFDIEPAPAPRMLELEVRLPSGDRVRSADTLMLAPSSGALAGMSGPDGLPAATQVARPVEVAPLFPDASAPDKPDIDLAKGDAGAAPDASDGMAAMPVADTDAPTRTSPSTLAMLVRADGTVELLGEAPRLPQAGAEAVSIDAVVYDQEGEVSVSGRARPGAAGIQIYLDNQPILWARATDDGNWQAQLDGIERGVYRLRVDELDEAAQVTSRAEIPFERVTPQIARDGLGAQALIVQPGNTLWRMAEDQFGDGRRYMRIFDANREQIRNPDLIYPGQVFMLPEADG